ncbi:MAG: Rpn family recombination-promoting nuclease/putative transposase, partial [Prosthecobacter sp.]|nr:Rpn family recombination-promoting nuclease/putative transposase [Prosthecobacter sp.]
MSDIPLDFASQPHDAFFKGVFRQPEQTAAFFQSHLPPGLAASIDWSSLKLLPGSFVDSSLRQSHSDLLFAANVGSDEILLYLLIEHQTTVDEAMPLRVLSYMLEIWQAHAKNHGLPLPPLLPFVLHQGPQAWTVSTHFEDLLRMPKEQAAILLPHVPKFSHALLDLTQFDPAQEEHHTEMRTVLQLLKLAGGNRLLVFVMWLADQGT